MTDFKRSVQEFEKNDTLTTEWRDDKDDPKLQQAAVEGNLKEHELTPIQALKMYPLAVMWCLLISTCVIMEGYDTILLGNLYAYPTFQRKFGVFVGFSPQSPSGYQLEAKWQAALSNGAGIGAFL